MIIVNEEDFIDLVKELEDIKKISTNPRKEAENLMMAINDISDSAKTILNEIVPKLNSSKLNSTDIQAILEDFYSEVKHIEYHTKKSTYLKSGSIV